MSRSSARGEAALWLAEHSRGIIRIPYHSIAVHPVCAGAWAARYPSRAGYPSSTLGVGSRRRTESGARNLPAPHSRCFPTPSRLGRCHRLVDEIPVDFLCREQRQQIGWIVVHCGVRGEWPPDGYIDRKILRPGFPKIAAPAGTARKLGAAHQNCHAAIASPRWVAAPTRRGIASGDMMNTRAAPPKYRHVLPHPLIRASGLLPNPRASPTPLEKPKQAHETSAMRPRHKRCPRFASPRWQGC